ncbi:MAG: DnaD domain protein [Clostridia bacterium]|nr:DnaD domain protein [Clostridia bacterium]
MNSIKITNVSASFSVSNVFVDKYMKEANASFVKVYLYILRHSAASGLLSLESVSEGCGLLQSDVVSALKYWDSEGVISYSGDDVSILSLKDNDKNCVKPDGNASINAQEENAYDTDERKFQPNISVSSNYRSSDVIKTVSSNESLAHLFAIISQLLNKSLTPTDYRIIYSFIDYLKLPEPVIIMLFEYCISNNKTAMRYIEKVAYSWADNGVNTTEKALEFIKMRTDENSIMSNYRKKFKISGRDFSETEEKMLLSWLNECKADEELIMKAYEIAVLNTGKVSFKYMDAVIRDELAHKNSKSQESLPSNVRKSSFRNYPDSESISDIEKKMIEKMMSRYGGESDAVNK